MGSNDQSKGFEYNADAQKVEVDGVTYRFAKYPTTRSLKYLSKWGFFLVKGGKGAFAGKFAGKKGDALGDSFMEMMMENLDNEYFVKMMEEIINHYVRDEKSAELNYEDYFKGNIFHLVKVVKTSIEVNYGDFLSIAKEHLGDIFRKKVETTSTAILQTVDDTIGEFSDAPTAANH